ncbi:MAG: hypothetical protein WHS83_15405 [Chloroflexus sp.]|uniref:hypothetical protein n=1 Tax=Chloroflexus sp. TaxID=1904827 RepID=UPI0030A6DB25
MAAALQSAQHAHNERVRQSIQHVLARLERRTATRPVAHNTSMAIIPADTHVVDTRCG